MKIKLLLLLLAILNVSVYADDIPMVSSAPLADSLIATSKKYIGVPYWYGGCSPSGFDCSGFAGYIFKHYGICLPRTSIMMSGLGEPLGTDFKEYKKGDLVFFAGRRNQNNVGHVGIFIELDDTLGSSFSFIHASLSGVMISHYNETYYRTRFKFARRILPEYLATNDLDSLLALAPKEVNLVAPLSSDTTLTTPPPPATIYHRIKSGDTLYGLARRYGTSVRAICRLNNISENAILSIGKSLRIK